MRPHLALALLLTLPATLLAEPPAPAPPQTPDDARRLVQDLESLARSQRTELSATESALTLARARLAALDNADQPKNENLLPLASLAETDQLSNHDLIARQKSLARKLIEAQRLSRHPDDPSITRTKQDLDALRADIATRLAPLLAQKSALARKLEEARRITRNPNDPSITRHREQFESLREQIKELQPD